MAIQAKIPTALCAVHNFIRIHDDDEINDFQDIDEDPEPGQEREGELAPGPANAAEKVAADKRRDRIAEAMWVDYQALLAQRFLDELK